MLLCNHQKILYFNQYDFKCFQNIIDNFTVGDMSSGLLTCFLIFPNRHLHMLQKSDYLHVLLWFWLMDFNFIPLANKVGGNIYRNHLQGCPSVCLSVCLCNRIQSKSFLKTYFENSYFTQRLLMVCGCVIILTEGHLCKFKLTGR